MHRNATVAFALSLAVPILAAAQPVQGPALGATGPGGFLPPIGGSTGGITSGIAPTIGNSAVGGSLTPVPATPPTGADTQAPAEEGLVRPGANGATMGGARAQFQGRGFKDVTNLHKDAKGVWHGKAVRNGQKMSVTLDGRGNVAGVEDSTARR